MDLFADDLPDTRIGDRSVAEPGQSPPPARAPRTGDRLDLGQWDAPESATDGSRRWLLVAAVVPWLVLIAILATTPRSPSPAPAPPTEPGATTMPASEAQGPSSTPTADVPAPDAAPSAGSPSPDDSVSRPSARLVGGTTPDTRGQAIGMAAMVARSWLSTRPDGIAVEGLDPSPGAEERYVEHLVVESVDHPARGALVVTVRALVLPVEGDAYGPAEQVRVAVPISLDADHARLAGTPWPLAVEDPLVEPPTTAPVDDPDLQMAATEAVMAAGYRDVSLVTLERTSGWAWVANVEARAPGQDEVVAHAVWLRSDVGRLVVAGAPAPAPADPPAAVPSTSASPSPSPETEVVE